ncbi:MAG: sigma-54 dependent transcriptional regulator [Proteobacteria bacterium]|nr:sigma-54 dependent transcriptional regulator [Pseudomonadota bacterium]
MSKGKVIFIDDEEHLRIASKQTLDLAGFDVDCFADAKEALDLLSRDFTGVVISDIRMPGMGGMEVLEKVLEVDVDQPVVLVTGHGDVQLAVEAMRKGAYDFIEKPFASNYLIDVVGRAIEKRRLTLENRELRSAAAGRDQLEARLMGRSKAVVELRQQIRSVAQTDADVLIIGETGTGKEVAARALHSDSARGDRSFVAINCGALPEALIESELFGHEPGAFPGATRARVGKFEHARGGTIFLDEIESMPMTLQVKLLRVIQERSITRLGSNDAVELDVRFIATSKVDLEAAAEAGKFRSDLLYRLNVITLTIPTLEQRKEDIPRLFTQLVNEACLRYRRDLLDIPAGTLAEMANRSWPGNVRELRNAADRFALGLTEIDEGLDGDTGPGSLADRVSEFEKNAIVAELAANDGQLKNTYESLGLSRKTLYEKMQKYKLSREEFNDG